MWLGRGNVFNDLKHFDEALAVYEKALALESDLAEAWLGCGNVFNDLKCFNQAFAAYDKALALKPDLAEAWLGRGNVLDDTKHYDDALAAYEKALTLKSNLAEAWLGHGNVFNDLKRFDEAFAAYENALAFKPDLAEVHFNEASLRLLLGEMESGWKKYEYRWETKQFRGWKRNFARPLWLGDSIITNKRTLLHAEQGLGDTLLACRYVPMVAALGAKVILEVQPCLKSLLQYLEGVSTLVAKGEEIPQFDVHCPIMSLPLALKTTMETIPARVPYLTASKDIIEKWRRKLSGVELRVGMAWAGNPNFPQDRDRSILLKNILPIFGVEGLQYFSLQRIFDLATEKH